MIFASFHDERVEVRVCLHQVWGHRERVVKVGKRRVRMRGAGVENGADAPSIGTEKTVKLHRPQV